MTHKNLSIKVLEAWSANHLPGAREYYTDQDIAEYVDSVNEMSREELLSELSLWER